MTAANLFAKHREGSISKEKFLYEVRKDSQLPFISNLTSYDDAIKMLKQKGIVKEQQELHLQIDRLNPILVKKAVNFELSKLSSIDPDTYQKVTEKVVKKLQKDPRCYDDILIANSKEIKKIDDKRKMILVKKELKDPNHQMKSPKGLEKIKSNVKSSKSENKKGKPKGVKEMSSTAKGHKGLDQMKQPETREKVIESLLSFMFKKKLNEDTHHQYGRGQGVNTPEGHGIVKSIVGSTVTLEYEDGKEKDYQINALNYFKEQSNLPAPETKVPESNLDEKKDAIIKKIVGLLNKKKKIKKEAVTAKTNDSSHNQDIYNRINKIPGQARTDIKKAYDSGKTIEI
jgi:hypothetical protein